MGWLRNYSPERGRFLVKHEPRTFTLWSWFTMWSIISPLKGSSTRGRSWQETRSGIIVNLSMPRRGSGTVGIVGWCFSSTIKFASSGCSMFWINRRWGIYAHLPLLQNPLVFCFFDLGICWRVHLLSRIGQEHMQGINKTLKREVGTRGIEVVLKCDELGLH